MLRVGIAEFLVGRVVDRIRGTRGIPLDALSLGWWQ